ncbi:hypothetical protein CcaCcLH18_11975 [Colletotrichum camelliae]|nr:hypothetical protein CcaCcLH18_11975 [Colletotrichum camelliae]
MTRKATSQQLSDNQPPSLPAMSHEPAAENTPALSVCSGASHERLVSQSSTLSGDDDDSVKSAPTRVLKREIEDPSLPPKRSRARAPPRAGEVTQKTGELCSPGEEPYTPYTQLPKPSTSRSFEPCSPGVDQTEVWVKQPETRPISEEQLVAEVKGIYAGLVMVESKCIEVVNAQGSTTPCPKLNNEQWQALIALHRTLLHEHHDFFLASQHPSASPALRGLASKYAMPERMWRHGIHAFLELLRHCLPGSLDHMLNFIYLAYSIMALLYETVPAFEDAWTGCLGDLGRYRMAIEDKDPRDCEVWASTSRHWYSKASDRAPTTGKMYHDLAILTRPKALQQLFYYSKSLCVPIPSVPARESIMTLFKALDESPTRLHEVDVAFVRAHGALFSGRSQELAPFVDKFIDSLDLHIGRTTRRWMESGYYIGIALGCSLLEYGSESNILMRSIKARSKQRVEAFAPSQKFLDALDFTSRTHDVVFRRFGDPSVYPYLHVTLSFLYYFSRYPAFTYIESKIPWKLILLMLNALAGLCLDFGKIEDEGFPPKQSPRPLPDDFAQRGLLWAEKYYPDNWFAAAEIDYEEKYSEEASMMEERQDRCLWLGRRIAVLISGRWLTYDENLRQFSVAARYDILLDSLPTVSRIERVTTQLNRWGRAINDDVDITDAPM